ncbi:tetratricopeptide repeat protein [Coraliomargarita parva]|uniref:tetratricopeptide repeat protein n=1 Tax=Coraliomargarita parva TaxID=3014050 RepID=UPI0022B33A13|nr:tetratricopeptide repeat protein [Coraliomargarita parva]
MRTVLPVLSFILILVCQAPAQVNKDRTELFYGIAQGNYLIGDLKGAAKGIDEILRIEPEHVPALKLRARIELDLDRSDDALATSELAISIAPEDLEAKTLKALILGRMDRKAEAIALLNEVLAAAPTDSRDARAAGKLIGLLRMAEGKWDEAAEALSSIYGQSAAEQAANLELASEAYLEKAGTAMKSDDVNSALAAIDQAIELYRDNSGKESYAQISKLRLLRARTLTGLGRISEAIVELQQLVGQQPENNEARITLASLYAIDERWDSLQGLLEPIQNRPGLQDILLYFDGRIALARGRVGTARAKFEAALDTLPEGPHPIRPSLQFYRAVCLDRLGRNPEAETALDQALESGFRPETGGEALQASQLILQMKGAAAAIPLLEAFALSPDAGRKPVATARIWAMLGRAHEATGNPPLALSAYRQSLEWDESQADVLALRGAILRQLGDMEGAANDFASALRIEPENGALAYAQGLLQLQLGKVRQARQSLELAADKAPDNAGLQLMHALLAYVVGQQEESEQALNRYFTLVPDKPNLSAIYLHYVLQATEDPEAALEYLKDNSKRAELAWYLGYCSGRSTRKEVIDAAGVAESAQEARVRICEASFWMAQHALALNQKPTAEQLLRLAVSQPLREQPEYILALWQLNEVLSGTVH